MAAVSLPPEIIAAIIYYLAGDYGYLRVRRPHKLAPYAAVSRAWQAAIERLTFSSLTLTPERLRAALASETLLDRRRFAAVRTIDVEVLLPAYDEAARSRVETDADRAANNAVFTQTVRDLFRLFARGVVAGAYAGDDDGGAPEVLLRMTALSLSDNVSGPRYRHPEYLARLQAPQDDDLLEERYASSYLELVPGGADDDEDGDPALPLLPMITRFECLLPRHRRYVAPAACAQIAARLPRLHTVRWRFNDNEKRDLAGRRARRAALARALPGLPASLARVRLTLHYTVQNDLFEHPVPLLDAAASADPAASTDPLSAALGRWARRTTQFLFAGTVTTAFWTALAGDDDDDDDRKRVPPPTSTLLVELSNVSPTGEWLLALPPPDPAYDERRELEAMPAFLDEPGEPLPEDMLADRFYRCCPDRRLWNAVLLASGRAVARLPALRDLQINVSGRSLCEVTYRAAERTVTFASYPFEPRAYRRGRGPEPEPLVVPNLFEPDDAVLQTWRDATRVQVGDDAVAMEIVNSASPLYTKHKSYSFRS